MADIKLAQLPDRTPVKLTIQIPPQLMADLALYAGLYKAAYGQEETVSELVPSMLTAFLESDRVFAKARSGLR